MIAIATTSAAATTMTTTLTSHDLKITKRMKIISSASKFCNGDTQKKMLEMRVSINANKFLALK